MRKMCFYSIGIVIFDTIKKEISIIYFYVEVYNLTLIIFLVVWLMLKRGGTQVSLFHFTPLYNSSVFFVKLELQLQLSYY